MANPVFRSDFGRNYIESRFWCRNQFQLLLCSPPESPPINPIRRNPQFRLVFSGPIVMRMIKKPGNFRCGQLILCGLTVLLTGTVFSGCGTTLQRVGTEQLLMSDAVDMAVAQIDFGPISDEKVFLDSSYLQTVQGFGFVNAPYIVSSLRQQLTAAGCLLQDQREKADVIVEPRVGALGTDGHEVIYGVPKNNLLNSAANVIPNAPAIPAIPEMSAARIDSQSGIAKLMVFAYDSKTREPIWQSGVARAESTSRSSWVLGAGPFQRGTVHRGKLMFAGEKLDPKLEVPFDGGQDVSDEAGLEDVVYFEAHEFQKRRLPANVGYFTKHQFENRRSVPSSGAKTRVATKPESRASEASDSDTL